MLCCFFLLDGGGPRAGTSPSLGKFGHEVRGSFLLRHGRLHSIMFPASRLRRQSTDELAPKPRVLTRSPPPSPQADVKPMREPYPIPSNNPASQYTLLEKLGTGSFGTVYKAIHNETKQIVAIKQIGE